MSTIYNGKISQEFTPLAHRIVEQFQTDIQALNLRDEITYPVAIDLLQKRQDAIIEALADLELELGKRMGQVI